MADKNRTRERDMEHMSIVERNRLRAEIQATFGEVRQAVKRVSPGIDVPINVPLEPSISDILALDRKVQDLKKAVGISAA